MTFLANLWTAFSAVSGVIMACSLMLLAALLINDWWVQRERRATMPTHPSHPSRQARTPVDIDPLGRWLPADDEAVRRVPGGGK